MESAESYSGSYRKIEQMIRRGEFSLSELEHSLDDLVAQQDLTPVERQALLELAWVRKIDNKLSARSNLK